ncbi:MAG: uracil-DNA glycosylase, partial [Planctomycetes bacterium]|nr:uracil-DNA glycosylase [Planctomycetota bacterium]
ARVMFVGEGPGAEEDRTGVPFVGAAGQLLSGIIEKGMQLSRANDVYIANVVKCRPPENRDPTPQEKAICSAWLDRQIELVDPAVIVPLGSHAAGRLLRSAAGIGRLRGRVHQLDGRKLVPTYHPAYVLRQSGPELAAVKAKVWDDIRLAMAELGL